MAEKSKLTVAAEIAAIVGCCFCAIGVVIAWMAYWDSRKPIVIPNTAVTTGATMLVSKVAVYCFMATVAFTVTASVLFFVASRKRKKESASARFDSSGSIAPLSIFDVEVYRIIRATKLAFASQTQNFFQVMGKGNDFKIDMDILIELYVVNISPNTQYIKEICGVVEVEGIEYPLVMQKGFSAFALNDDPCEWCLDPTPQDASDSFHSRQQKLETLPPLADSFPVALEPKKPLEGWVRLLISQINPEKLDGTVNYNLTIKDSLGVAYPIIKAVKRDDRGEIATRRVATR